MMSFRTRPARGSRTYRRAATTGAPAQAAIGNQAVLRRLAADPPAPQSGAIAPAAVGTVLGRQGQGLDAPTRGFFERSLGVDLGGVRVHTDAAADRSAQAVGARAYAAGLHLVFRAGSYDPAGPAGFRLLAHELAHVVQSLGVRSQGAATEAGRLRIGNSGAPEEHEAASAASRLAAGEKVSGLRAAGEPALRRQTADEEPKPSPKPLVPLPVLDKLDFKPFLPLPGGSAPTPYDQPGAGSGPSGGGPSVEDLHGGVHALLDKPAQPGLSAGKMPSCSVLETAESTRMKRRYRSFEQYDQSRRLFHGPLSKDAWPQLSGEAYNTFITTCPQGETPLLMPDMPVKKAPLPDAPVRTLPKGQEYA